MFAIDISVAAPFASIVDASASSSTVTIRNTLVQVATCTHTHTYTHTHTHTHTITNQPVICMHTWVMHAGPAASAELGERCAW
jgi:hypothetical protein